MLPSALEFESKNKIHLRLVKPEIPEAMPQLGNQRCGGECGGNTARKEGELCPGCWFAANAETKFKPMAVPTAPKADEDTAIHDDKPFGIKAWPKGCSVVPNSIARSSVFGIKTRDFKGVHSQITTKIHCEKQLSHEHFMIWLACVNEVKAQHNYTFYVSASSLIRTARLNIKHARFNQIMYDLAALELEITTTIRGEYRAFKGKLLKGVERDEDGLKIALDPKLEQIFARNSTIIDLDQIAAIKSRIARAIYPYVRSHRATEKGVWATLDMFRCLVGSAAGDGRKRFHRHLVRAFDELKELELISSFERKFKANKPSLKFDKNFDVATKADD
ncbi:MAG: hypothetical protein Q9N02_06600 [Ghiorsea sp.]|nr:hypothetical protein [Ghiorsea sp.]